MNAFLLLAIVVGATGYDGSQVAANESAPKPAAKPTSEVVLASEIEWQQLNPARGDASPKAATLWGDRNGTEATGFLVKFVNGFSSPPHIHNVTYRGVVIDGLVHNDDPKAKPMWMPPGSFWTQPAGEVHITAAKGGETVAYIEIEKGPYLVLPSEEAFDRGEQPVNLAPSNIVWLDASNTTWIDPQARTTAANRPMLSHLWGIPENDQLNGALVWLPSGFVGAIESPSSLFRVVVIQGHLTLEGPDETDDKILPPGSYLRSTGRVTHKVACDSEEGCIVYARTQGKFKVIPEHGTE